MTRRALSFLALFLLTGGPALAEPAQNSTAEKALSGDTFALNDNRLVRLDGIAAPRPDTPELADTARATLEKLIAGKSVTLENAAIDRYGRIAAQGYVASDNGARTWLQEAQVRGGFAFVFSPVGDAPLTPALIAAENDARNAKRGIWADDAYADTPAAKAWRKVGSFAFITGKIVKANRVKEKIYLNFGDDWHKDFAVVIAAHDLVAFRAAQIDPLTYEGKTVRVRGWVAREAAAVMMVNAPGQIQILAPP